MALLLEFLNENAHRYYPFAPTNTGTANEVPTALILDLGIIATTNLPDNSGTNSTYISKIVTDGVQVRFYFAADVGGIVQDFGCLATVDVDDTIDKRTNFKYAGNGYILEGFIVTGDLSVTAAMPATTMLDKDSGRIYTGCIQHMSSWLAGIQIGEQTLSGIIEFVAGAGIDFSISGNTVTINCTGAVLPPDNAVITSDEKLLGNITQQYGTPITHINGTAIGADWNIVSADDSNYTIAPDYDTHSITVNNLSAQACCDDSDIAVLTDNISALNDRVGVLNTFLNQVSTNLNILSVQASRLN